jgi:ADP-L-glycero-D-manno-heptose 6-epimerase
MIIVTGAAGFIGSVIVKLLNDRGEDVVVADSFGTAGKFKNLRRRRISRIVTPDRLLIDLESGSLRPSAIIHMGAVTDTSIVNADLFLEMNTQYTERLTRLALGKEIRLIYASSASVYGDGDLGFSDKNDLTSVLCPLTPYGFSKWLFDSTAIRMGWDRDIVGLRFFNVYGPNEYHKGNMASVIWHAYNQFKSTESVTLYKSHNPDYADGEQKRDFVYVDDVARVVLWFLYHPEVNGIFNLGTGKARTYKEMAEAVFYAVDKKPRIEYVPTPETIRGSYQYFKEADISKLKNVGCDVPFHSLEDGVEEYVRNYLSQNNCYL